MAQGNKIPLEIETKVVRILRETDLQFIVIAERFNISPSAVKCINYRNRVRSYNGNGKKYK